MVYRTPISSLFSLAALLGKLNVIIYLFSIRSTSSTACQLFILRPASRRCDFSIINMKAEAIYSFALVALVAIAYGIPLQTRYVKARAGFIEPTKDFEIFEAREAYVNTGKNWEVPERRNFIEKRANSTATAAVTVATTPADLPG